MSKKNKRRNEQKRSSQQVGLWVQDSPISCAGYTSLDKCPEIVTACTKIAQMIHWTITEADLHEVSVCTFPAYEETAVSARKNDFEEIRKRKADKWRSEMMKKLKGATNNGT